MESTHQVVKLHSNCHVICIKEDNFSDRSNMQVQNFQESDSISTICDKRLGNSFTTEGMEELIQLIVHCVDSSSERRPPMTAVVTELDRILEKEMSLTTIMGEGTPIVTLGSQLFRASKY